MDQMRRIVLARRPTGMPQTADFRLSEGQTADPGPGEMIVVNRVLSIDPAIRGFLDDRESYLPPVEIGATVRGMVLGEVAASRNPAFPEGSVVRALAGWEERSVLDAAALGLEPVAARPGVPLTTYMGALGPAGLTAWIGLHEIGEITAGQTVVISAAAGAVGSIAGQVARLRGCRVVGLAGSDAKIAQLSSLGFNAGVNYRDTPDLAEAVKAVCPDGVDLYFDNVGGEILETMLPLMNARGHVVVCGMVSQYNDADHPHGVRTLWQLVVKRITLRGFLTYDHADRLGEAQADLSAWVESGDLRALETLYAGLESAPDALIAMLGGATTGKTLVTLN